MRGKSVGHFRMGECPDLGVTPAEGGEGCFEEGMGQDREGDAAGSGVSISPSIWGWGCGRGTFAGSSTKSTGQNKVQRALVLPKRKSEVKVEENK